MKRVHYKSSHLASILLIFADFRDKESLFLLVYLNAYQTLYSLSWVCFHAFFSE